MFWAERMLFLLDTYLGVILHHKTEHLAYRIILTDWLTVNFCSYYLIRVFTMGKDSSKTSVPNCTVKIPWFMFFLQVIKKKKKLNKCRWFEHFTFSFYFACSLIKTYEVGSCCHCYFRGCSGVYSIHFYPTVSYYHQVILYYFMYSIKILWSIVSFPFFLLS